MKAQHTPGPWLRTSDNCEGQTLCAIVKEDEKIGGWSEVIGWVNRYNGNSPEANAALIAAAPELLEALKYYASTEAQQHGYDNGALARAVIAKATGQ